MEAPLIFSAITTKILLVLLEKNTKSKNDDKYVVL